MSHAIYGLYDPRVEPRMIRYVGYSGKGLQSRLREHCAESLQSVTCHRTKWISKLLREGVRPAIIELERVDASTWQERERHWIATLRSSGKLTNSTDGGEGLINPTKDVRDRIAAKVSVHSKGNQHRKGIPHSDEDRAKISSGLRLSEKAKLSNAARVGRNPHASMTPEQRAAKIEKIRQSKLGKTRAPFSIEARRNMSIGHTGLKHTSTTKDRIRAANIGNTHALGNKQTESARAAIRAAKTGTKWITNGTSSSQISPGQPIPTGWRLGRK